MTTSPPHFPDSFETERLHIRAKRPGDGMEIYEAVRDSIAELSQWMSWAQQLETPEAYEARARKSAENFHRYEDMTFGLHRKPDQYLVGVCGLHLRDADVPSYEIGYWARSSCSGNGYISEAVKALTTLAFERLHANRVEIRCDANNRRSAAVAERCGYTLEARLRHHRRTPQGALADTLIFTMLKPQSQQ